MLHLRDVYVLVFQFMFIGIFQFLYALLLCVCFVKASLIHHKIAKGCIENVSSVVKVLSCCYQKTFCHIFFWLLSFGYNFTFSVLSLFEFLSFVKVWVGFFHNFSWVLSQGEENTAELGANTDANNIYTICLLNVFYTDIFLSSHCY